MSAPLRLKPFQVAGSQFLAGRKVALLADRMGLGKTPQAIAALDAIIPRHNRSLIVAPLATALGWQREVARWTNNARSLTILRRKDQLPGPHDTGWYFIPWTDLAVQAPRVLAECGRFDVLVLDEMHRAKSGKNSKVGKATWGEWAEENGTWVLQPGVFDAADRVFALSGTPMPNGRPIELFPFLQRAGVSCARSRQKFVQRYCYRENRWTPSGFDDQGAINMEELNSVLKREVMLARTPEDVPGELPALRRVTEYLSGVKTPRELETIEIVADEEGNPRAVNKESGLPAFEEMAEYRATLGRAKVKAVAEWVQEYVTDGGVLGKDDLRPIVVFVHHKDVMRGIAEALTAEGIRVVTASGDDDADVRQARVDEFADAGGPHVFIGTTAACGTGMNGLHRRTTVCAFAEGEWSPAELDQAEGRIRRMGGVQTGMAMAFYLLVSDTLESHIMNMIIEKRENIDTALADAAHAAIQPAATSVAAAPQVDWAAALPAREETSEAPDAGLLPMTAPEPTAVAWSWAKDDQTGEWVARAACDAADAPWTGAQIEITNRAGKTTLVRLGERLRGGAHGGGWSLWSLERVQTNELRMIADAGYIKRRASYRGVDAAHDDTPITSPDDLAAAAAAHNAVCRLTHMDPDQASARNDMGWNKADVTCGRVLAGIPPKFWDHGVLAFARAILCKYRFTQVADLWPTIEKTF